MASSSNIPVETRTKILHMGWQMETENPKFKNKMNMNELARRAGVSKNTAKLWWRRRDEFLASGELKHQPRSGRPLHNSFNTPEKLEKALDVLEDLREGEHSPDAAKKLRCCRKTLYNHTNPQGLFKVPPKSDINANKPSTKRKRMDFASHNLTPTGKLKKKLKKSATMDHKMVSVIFVALERT